MTTEIVHGTVADGGAQKEGDYNRRRCSLPGGSAPENDRLIRAVHAAALRRRE